MNEYREKFNQYLKKFFINHHKLGVYSEICSSGKRLRPILIFGIAKFLKNDWENTDLKDKIYKFALIVELIHNTSLIIDDLPSMDNDQYRRNNLTFHYKYGVKKAYLIVYNLLVIIKRMILELSDFKITPLSLQIEELINIEISNLIKGQSLDLDPTWKPLIGSRVLKIADYKTVSLFRLSIIGVFLLLRDNICVDAEYMTDNLLKIGEDLGMAFQLSDDYLDIGVDKEFNNYALETSPEKLKIKFDEYINDLEMRIKEIGMKEDFMSELILMLKKRLIKE
uniref:Polyprenyl synthetase n=1 Tax=viral metagenome TaxID=1070528 RepID=A0A6C0E8U8_9ZZZZ